ncbi:glycosyltransferase [Trichloromonas sp.]|uniref:glycosyltransferase n=1 Tax=Trichloromonas sp. TaxID=3069249 RepID=UPI003D819F9D
MILFLTLQLGGKTGVFKSALDVLSALLATDESVTVVSGRGDKSDKLPPFLNGVDTGRVFLKHLPAVFNFSGMSFFKPVKTVFILVDFVVFFFRRLLLRSFMQPELILVNGLCSHDVWNSIEIKTDAPKVLIVRESPRHFLSPTASRDLDWALGVMAEYDHYVFVSSNCRDEWGSMDALKNIPCDYIPNCCEEEKARQLLENDKARSKHSLGLPSDRFLIMCIGSLQPRKGQDIVIENLAAIVQEIPQALVCFVGADPLCWKQDLEKKVEQSGLTGYVRFFLEQSCALEWIYAADALLLASRAEAMPRVVLEAMVLKTPVVAAEVDGVSELIEHERTGWLFSHENVGDMVSGLKAATSADLSSEIVQEASMTYWTQFSRKFLVERYCLALEKIKRVQGGD